MAIGKSSKSLILLALVALIGFGAFYIKQNNDQKAAYAANKGTYLGNMESELSLESQKELEGVYDTIMSDPGNAFNMPTYVVKKEGRTIALSGASNSVDEIFNNN